MRRVIQAANESAHDSCVGRGLRPGGHHGKACGRDRPFVAAATEEKTAATEEAEDWQEILENGSQNSLQMG